MKYPHAYSGVKKIFISAIFEVVASLISIVAAVFLVIPDAKDTNSPLFIAATALASISGALLIVSFILQLIGLFQGKKDEGCFAGALWIILVAIFATVGSVGFSLVNAEWARYTSIALDGFASACSTIVIAYILMGIAAVANRLGEKSFAASGIVLRNILLVLLFASIVMHLVSNIIRPNPAITSIMGFVTVSAAVVELVAYVWYLIYLGRAPKKLSK